MTRWFLAVLLLGASVGVAACPVCLGSGQPSKAQQLITAQEAVLAVPTSDASRFRVIEVIKGKRPPTGTVEGGYPRFGPASDTAKHDKPLLLVREDPLPNWVVVGPIGAEHLGWLRRLAVGKRTVEMSADDWQARVALMLPYLESREPLVAEIAFGELAAAPYDALLTTKSRLAAPVIRRWLADPTLSARESLYLLLIGIAGDARDAAALERRLDTAWSTGDAKNLASLIAGDLQLRGVSRLGWVEERYLVDRRRSAAEVEAALMALSVHGEANGAIPRERVITAYKAFMRAHPDIAGYVARDLAAWQYWDAAPEYVALLESGARQQYPSRIAILAYLRQAPNTGAPRAANPIPTLPR